MFFLFQHLLKIRIYIFRMTWPTTVVLFDRRDGLNRLSANLFFVIYHLHWITQYCQIFEFFTKGLITSFDTITNVCLTIGIRRAYACTLSAMDNLWLVIWLFLSLCMLESIRVVRIVCGTFWSFNTVSYFLLLENTIPILKSIDIKHHMLFTICVFYTNRCSILFCKIVNDFILLVRKSIKSFIHLYHFYHHDTKRYKHILNLHNFTLPSFLRHICNHSSYTPKDLSSSWESSSNIHLTLHIM